MPPRSSHGEHVRVRELELQREADDVEVLERARGLERHEREVPRAELLLHVDPRRVGTLGERARIVVEDLVEDLEAEVAHPDVVDVGEREAHARIGSVPVLADGAVLTAEVASRLVDAVNELRVGMNGHCTPRI